MCCCVSGCLIVGVCCVMCFFIIIIWMIWKMCLR